MRVSRGVQRWVAIALIILIGVVYVVLVNLAPAQSHQPIVWVAVPQSDFTTFPASSSGPQVPHFGQIGVQPTTSPAAPSGTPVPSLATFGTGPVPSDVASPKATRTRPAPTVKPRTAHPPGRYLTAGWATMTDTACAAAGAGVRLAFKHAGLAWRGQPVRVWYGKQHADTTLCDWCACGDRHGGPTVLDLPPWMWASFGKDPGVIWIRVERL